MRYNRRFLLNPFIFMRTRSRMGNMDQFSSDSDRGRVLPLSPGEEEDDEDADEHEQLRLVPTPDPIFFSRTMDFKKDNQSSSGGGNGRNKIDPNFPNNFTSIQCQNEFYSNYLCTKESKESSRSNLCAKFLKEKWRTASPLQWLMNLMPILSWLPSYNWKTDLIYDASAGFTVAVMSIPQGLAYAMLANVEPVVGLYMAFFPVIIYALLGTSRHVSIGTFAVICLMTGKVASEKAAYYEMRRNETSADTQVYSTTEIAATLSFFVGVWQLIMGVLQLGSLSVLLSSELISGFTTGCAVHVLTSQIKSLLGLRGGDRRTGIFKIPLTYQDIVLGIANGGNLNVTAVIVSLLTIFSLLVYNELLKTKLQKKIPFPIPIELIAIIIGTLVSRYWITSDAFGIPIVSHIPTGLPNPALPKFRIVPDILVDSLIIAVVAYAISISMVKIFAIKHEYEIRPNQELVANGTSNAFGSFFSCAPIAVSLTRSLIQEQVGGKTQLAGVFTSVVILFVLLWIGPFFETLPLCVLSSLIVVALKGMFLQFKDLPKSWRESRVNGTIWLVSFLATVFLDIEYGLVLGLVLTLTSLLWNSNKFRVTEVGKHLDSNLFVEMRPDNKQQVTNIPGVKILKLTGNMNFVTADSVTSTVCEIIENSQPVSRRKSSGKYHEQKQNELYTTAIKIPISTVILDFSSVSSVDPAGVKCTSHLYDTESKQGITLLFAACPPNVLHTMDHCKFFDHVNPSSFYPSIEHAVEQIQSESSEAVVGGLGDEI